MSTLFIFLLLIALMLPGMPISIALGLTVLSFIFTMTEIPTESVALKLFTGIDNFEIMAIPFFILAGNFLTHGGVARRMINFATSMVGHWYGGRGLAGVMACALFAAISGSSPATVIAIGSIMLPAMVAQGYPKRFGAGVITTSGALGILIPPSIVMVIYSVATGGSVALGPNGERVLSASVGQLFIAGVVPGLMLATLLGVTTFYRAWKNSYPRMHLGAPADRDRARRHLRRMVHADRGGGDERSLCLHHRRIRLQGHDAQGRAARAARLGQHERDDPLHHHQRGAVLVPDDERTDPAAVDVVDHRQRRKLGDVPDLRQRVVADRGQRHGGEFDRPHHRAAVVPDRGEARHPSGASRHPDGGEHGSGHVPPAGRSQPLCRVRHCQDGHYRTDHRGVAVAADDAGVPRGGDVPSRNLAVVAAHARHARTARV